MMPTIDLVLSNVVIASVEVGVQAARALGPRHRTVTTTFNSCLGLLE